MTGYTIDRLNACLDFAGFAPLPAAFASEKSITGCTRLASEIARLEVHYGLDEIVQSMFAMTLKCLHIGERLAAIEAHQKDIAEQ